VSGDAEHVNKATRLIRTALLASGYTDQPPERHLRVVPGYADGAA